MIYDIILNIEKSGIKPRIKVSQYDKTLPQIRATLYSNNQAFNIPSGSTVYISGTKKDNTGFKYECSYSENVITADITEQMTAFSGDVEVEFTIESSGSRKGTENFILEVEKAALEDDVVISETDIPALQRFSQPASTTQLGVVKVDGTSVTVDADGTLHSSGGGGGAVQSVNGKTGAVVLDADDIDDTETTNKFTNATEKQAWNGKSTVSVTQIKSSGEKIATINVNGTDTDLYASAGGGGGGAVDSVNGKTGDVVLTASDVGALADDTPIPSDLSDLSDVDTSGVTDGQILKYNATSGKFLPSNESGGGTTDYTDLTNKPSINGVTLSGNKTSADLGISGGSNENLLDNPWFTVNQRGFTSILSANKNDNTLFDRWKNANGGDTQSSTISLGSSGLTLTQDTTTTNPWQICLDQIMEENVISNKVITFSVLLADGTLIKSSGLFNADIINEYDISTNLKLVYGMWTYNGKVRARIGIRTPQSYSQSASVTIRAVKLELGTESTLALDVAPNYTEELLKCQRYYYPLGGGSSSELHNYMGRVYQTSLSESLSEATIILPTAMRTTPTFSGSIIGNDFNGNNNNLTDVEVKGVQNITISGVWGTTPTYGAGYIQFGYANQISYLSAEL